MDIKKRGLLALNLGLYDKNNKPEKLMAINDIIAPTERQYVLRCLIRKPNQSFKLPTEMEWVNKLLHLSIQYQNAMGLHHPFCYLTIRHGLVDSVKDDEWHVDGFSTRITHLPEQIYIWTDSTPTEYITKKIKFPYDFDPLKHNIHNYIQKSITEQDKVKTMEAKTLYCIDPYIIHRRPAISAGQMRTFVRISYTPIEINDINNTFNPLLPTDYRVDGIKNFRDKLIDYPIN